MWFFAVRLIESNQFIAIPEEWIRDLNPIVFEKFANKGLNTDQPHVCYFSNQESAKTANGEPNPSFVPNFNASRSVEYPCADGTFYCQILKYTRKFKDKSWV